MKNYLPLMAVIVLIAGLIAYGLPQLSKKLVAERQIYIDEAEALEMARATENAARQRASIAIVKNKPFSEFNKEWLNITQPYARAEDAQRMILSEAQKIGLKVGRSKLLAPQEYNTLEGKVMGRQYEINVEGSHQQLGQWMARCESLIRTLRPVVADWYPYGTSVQANVAFQLLDDPVVIEKSNQALPAVAPAVPIPTP